MPQQTHKYSALFVLICSPRAATAAMAAARGLSIAGLAFQRARAPAQKVGQLAKLSFTRKGAL
jgi:hypothetical protein